MEQFAQSCSFCG